MPGRISVETFSALGFISAEILENRLPISLRTVKSRNIDTSVRRDLVCSFVGFRKMRLHRYGVKRHTCRSHPRRSSHDSDGTGRLSWKTNTYVATTELKTARRREKLRVHGGKKCKVVKTHQSVFVAV